MSINSSDISLCTNQTCELRQKCLRALINPKGGIYSFCEFHCNKKNKWEYMIKVNKI